ncbi:hypothetical protein KYG_19158 [Acidovorax sp. NO-1]|nr:hypothetical protein KYG_19158 [Acidovorax sp. NO-1]
MLFASLGAAIAFLSIAAFCILPAVQTPFMNADGTPDNAPIRGAGILILISPLIFVLLSAGTFSIAALLQRFNRLTPRSLATIAVATSLCLAVLMVLSRPFGWRDQLYYMACFSVFLLVTFGTSTLVWWKIANWPRRATGTDTQFVDAECVQR